MSLGVGFPCCKLKLLNILLFLEPNWYSSHYFLKTTNEMYEDFDYNARKDFSSFQVSKYLSSKHSKCLVYRLCSVKPELTDVSFPITLYLYVVSY